MMVCTTCNGVSLYSGCIKTHYGYDAAVDFLEFLEGAVLLWPTPAELHPAVPERVKAIYRDAAAVKQRSASSFAVQIRRAVEAICRDQGEVKGSLAERIKKLADAGKIPGALAEMTDFLRTLGNAAAHDDEADDIKPGYVEPIDEFFRAVIEYVYIAPFKVHEFKDRLENADIPF